MVINSICVATLVGFIDLEWAHHQPVVGSPSVQCGAGHVTVHSPAFCVYPWYSIVLIGCSLWMYIKKHPCVFLVSIFLCSTQDCGRIPWSSSALNAMRHSFCFDAQDVLLMLWNKEHTCVFLVSIFLCSTQDCRRIPSGSSLLYVVLWKDTLEIFGVNAPQDVLLMMLWMYLSEHRCVLCSTKIVEGFLRVLQR